MKNSRATSFAISVITILISQSCGPRSEAPITNNKPHYIITIDDQNIRHIAVEGIVPLSGDTLVMSQIMAEQLEHGYAEFIQGLKVFDENGRPVPVSPTGRSAWKLDVKTPATVRLQYTVNIDHDKIDWDVSSAFARGYALDNAVFFVGRVIFITPTTIHDPVEVQYMLPKGWEVATSLQESKSNPSMFEAKSIGQLLNNGMLAGKLAKTNIQVGDLQVEIAGPADLREGIGLFHDAMEQFVSTYRAQMGGALAGKLVVIAALSYAHSPGGEAFPNSISMMLSGYPDNSNKSYWGYLLSHEIYHLWNGHSIRPANQSEVEWFVEGFTQYMSRLTAYKTGFMSRDEFEFEISRANNSYSSIAGNISPLEAGDDKGRNFRLIYDGGMVIARELDREITTSTKAKGLEDFMKMMFEKFGKPEKPYTYEDIVNTATEVAEKDMSLFFRDYVAGTKVLDVK